MKYSTIIGLEVHVELQTKSKMFCRCPASHFNQAPNSHCCPVCLGLPGALPVANKQAVEWTILMGLALNCQISDLSKFDRKNYFYPDLPKGYQISQYDLPLCQKGQLEKVRIRRVHLEEDTGKLVHLTGATLIDFNRSGVPLMEIVTEPDLKSASQAKEFLQTLQQIVRFLGISDADMEKGQMRCEPTVNLKIEKQARVFYTPLVEIKNINSFRFVSKAIEYETQRQRDEFEKTGIEKQAGNKTTRGWNENLGQTVLQREKEEAADYRYFPEPDVPPIRLAKHDIQILRDKLPELPEAKTKRFIAQYGLSEYQAKILTQTREKADLFEKYCRQPQKLSLVEIANLIINKKGDLTEILEQKSKTKITDSKEIEEMVKAVIKENKKAIEDYQKGKANVLQFLIGQIMAKVKGQADANVIRKIFEEKLSHG